MIRDRAPGRCRMGWLAGAAVFAVLLFPLDGRISELARSLPLGGDLRRELEVLQQYGAPASMLIAAWLIWLLDPARRRRLLDWAVAVGLTGVAGTALKLLVGRPRPTLADPALFLGPWRTYLINAETGPRYAWEFWRDGSAELWSMPSNHAAYAVVMSVFLARTYPALEPFAIAMAVLVGACRVVLGAHYPTDVILGAALGYALARETLSRSWGTRLLHRLQTRRRGGRDAAGASPALPVVRGGRE